jgi:hypothetical protein
MKGGGQLASRIKEELERLGMGDIMGGITVSFG